MGERPLRRPRSSPRMHGQGASCPRRESAAAGILLTVLVNGTRADTRREWMLRAGWAGCPRGSCGPQTEHVSATCSGSGPGTESQAWVSQTGSGRQQSGGGTSFGEECAVS